MKNKADTVEASVKPAATGVGIAWLFLAALLCLLAVRVTLSEVLHPTLAQRMWALVSPTDDHFSGPAAATTLGLATLTLLLAGAAAFVVRLRRIDWTGLALMGAIGVWLAVSTWAATNRFAALVGAADLLAAIAAGWAVGTLCRGERERRLVVSMLVAILTAWVARGIVQYLVDFPDLFDFYRQHKVEALQQNGITPGSAQETAFWYRLHAREISGFVTMSNVYANGLIGLCTVALGIVLGAMFRNTDAAAIDDREERKRTQAKGRDHKGKSLEYANQAKSTEIPLYPILIGGAIVLLAGGIACLRLTGSKGGLVATVACLAALGAGVALRRWIAAHRGLVAWAAAAAFVCGAIAVVGYGLKHDALPSKSMLFRWHYWTATAPMVGAHPWTGVGLNNYGDFYSSLKRPSSPEDVKDPHSFFVRLVAEGGLPLALLMAGIVGVYFFGAAKREDPVAGEESADARSQTIVLVTGALIIPVWWIAHTLLAEPMNAYSAAMSAVYGVLALAGLTLASALFDEMRAEGKRIVVASVVVGAAGMLFYDQVNMALVTGPVAMLFWVMMGTATTETQRGHGAGIGGKIAGTVLVAMGLTLGLKGWGPTVEGTFSWDPGPWEEQYALHATRAASAKAATTRPGMEDQVDKLRDVQRAENEAALAAINRALMLAPRDGGLIRQRIRVRSELGFPVADDIRTLLTLDQGNAGVRVELAKGESDLPAQERAEILERALWLDEQLPAGEAKKLTKEQRAEVAAIIERLKRR